jgi:hypothetical protein
MTTHTFIRTTMPTRTMVTTTAATVILTVS